MIVLAIGFFMFGVVTGAFFIALFAARAYDKGELKGYEDGKREGFNLGLGLVD